MTITITDWKWAVGEVRPRPEADDYVPTFKFPTQDDAQEFLESLPDVKRGRFYLEPVPS